MYYEVIYLENGKKKQAYPQTPEDAIRFVESVKENLISCVACNNYEAYKEGENKVVEYLLKYAGVPSLEYVTEEQRQAVIDDILDVPYEHDPDMAYYILCEYESVKAANDYYREVTA